MSSAPDASSSIAVATGFAAGLLDPASLPPVFLAGPGGKLATRRYAVYRNNVVMGLGSALEEIFPAVRRIVGDAFFAGMARLYLRRHPPSSPLLFAYGADFPAFVEDFEPARALPYLADVARIERAWLDAFHAADAPSVDAGFFGSASPDELDELRFAPHPALGIRRPHHLRGQSRRCSAGTHRCLAARDLHDHPPGPDGRRETRSARRRRLHGDAGARRIPFSCHRRRC